MVPRTHVCMLPQQTPPPPRELSRRGRDGPETSPSLRPGDVGKPPPCPELLSSSPSSLTAQVHGHFRDSYGGILCLYSSFRTYVCFHFRIQFSGCGDSGALTDRVPWSIVTLTCGFNTAKVINSHYSYWLQQKCVQLIPQGIDLEYNQKTLLNARLVLRLHPR